jgi:hypothetical protein
MATAVCERASRATPSKSSRFAAPRGFAGSDVVDHLHSRARATGLCRKSSRRADGCGPLTPVASVRVRCVYSRFTIRLGRSLALPNLRSLFVFIRVYSRLAAICRTVSLCQHPRPDIRTGSFPMLSVQSLLAIRGADDYDTSSEETSAEFFILPT